MKICFENITTQMPILQEKVYMGLEFQVEDDKVCYTPLKDKCEAIQNLDSLKTLKQTRAFLWHGQFPVFIFTRLKKDANIYMTCKRN